jgi:hypothetical protein
VIIVSRTPVVTKFARVTLPIRKHQIANFGARHCSSDFVFWSTWKFSSMCLSGHRVQDTYHGNKSASQAAYNCAGTRQHTVQGLIRSRESAAMNKNSCIAVATRVRNSKRDQIPSGSKRKTNDRDLQRSEYWRFGVVGHADSLRTNDHVDRAPANTVSKIRNGPTGASVQHFVRWLLELLRSIARSRSRHHTT